MKVLDIGRGIAPGYAARMLASTGARVIRVINTGVQADPAAWSRRWLLGCVDREGAIAFGVDPVTGAALGPGTMYHGRAAVVIEALARLGGARAQVEQARAWLRGLPTSSDRSDARFARAPCRLAVLRRARARCPDRNVLSCLISWFSARRRLKGGHRNRFGSPWQRNAKALVLRTEMRRVPNLALIIG